MEKLMPMRSFFRSIFRRSEAFYLTQAAGATGIHRRIRQFHFAPISAPVSSRSQDISHTSAMRLGGTRSYSEDVVNTPTVKDLDIERAFKDLMASSWDKIPPSVVANVKVALTKDTEEKEAQESLQNVYRAAAAVEEFSGIIMSLKMNLDDEIGASGENSKPLPEVYVKALQTIFNRHAAYLASFEPEESYLRKKVEMELGTAMIYLKMRCGGLDADWGKVSVLGTSGLAGSYVEQRA
ncbi:hypothetical protein M569_02239 [Genlisea aurea]|uniref:Succinate dehydrogenase subunit 5, mitochondrial n=1 Tax=Genlisea aurea TaxID=192259 RepID=S8CZL6_9LAMI|nr:hypothetical protein M569_02239 [Genlisea aurea]